MMACKPLLRGRSGEMGTRARVLAGLVAGLMVCSAWARAGETIVYPDDPTLQSIADPFDPLDPPWVNIVAPANSDTGKSDSLSGNSVTVNDDGVATTPDWAIGAMNFLDSDAVTNNQVFINGNVGNAIGGLALNAFGAATATGNSVTVNNSGTVNGYLLGAWAIPSP